MIWRSSPTQIWPIMDWDHTPCKQTSKFSFVASLYWYYLSFKPSSINHVYIHETYWWNRSQVSRGIVIEYEQGSCQEAGQKVHRAHPQWGHEISGIGKPRPTWIRTEQAVHNVTPGLKRQRISLKFRAWSQSHREHFCTAGPVCLVVGMRRLLGWMRERVKQKSTS